PFTIFLLFVSSRCSLSRVFLLLSSVSLPTSRYFPGEKLRSFPFIVLPGILIKLHRQDTVLRDLFSRFIGVINGIRSAGTSRLHHTGAGTQMNIRSRISLRLYPFKLPVFLLDLSQKICVFMVRKEQQKLIGNHPCEEKLFFFLQFFHKITAIFFQQLIAFP